MKRLIAILLPAAIILSALSACAAKPVSFNRDQLEQLALELTESLINGDYDNVFINVDKSIEKDLSAEKIQEGWEGSVGSAAPENFAISKTDYSADEKAATVVQTISFNGVGYAITFVFNGDSKITGLWFMPTDLPSSVEVIEPVENDVLTEIPITVGATDQKMAGMLTLPKNVEKPPVAILIQGSGSSNMNEQILVNKPFEDIAYALAAKGVATIRYNKRYYEFLDRLQLDFTDLTIYDEVIDDVNAAIEAAAADERVNPDKIYLIGHSLGGMLAPKIAKDNDKVAGIVSMAGTLRKMQDLISDQNKAALAASDLSEEEQKKQLDAIMEELAKITADDDEVTILGYPKSYWTSMNDIDGAAIAKSLEIPMLILQGGADWQVYPDIDYKLWQDTLSGKENVFFKEYDGLNHLFMTTNGKKDTTEYDTKGTVSQEVTDDIALFINGEK